MTLADIRRWPTVTRDGKTHESVLRAWNCLQKVCELLARGTPADVVLEIVNDTMTAPQPGDVLPSVWFAPAGVPSAGHHVPRPG